MVGHSSLVEHIELKTEAEQAKRIRYAAELARQSVNRFVLDAAAERAER